MKLDFAPPTNQTTLNPSAHRRGVVLWGITMRQTPFKWSIAMQNEINELRHQVRTLKRMLFGVIGLVVIGGLLAATSVQSVPDAIQAKRIEILSENGTPIAILGASEISSTGPETQVGGSLSLFSDDGKQLASLGTNSVGFGGGGGLDIYNKDAVRIIGLASLTNGGSSGTFKNSSGRTCVGLGAAGLKQNGFLTVNGKDGRVVALGAAEDGGTIMTWAADAYTVTSRIPAPQ